MPEMPGLEVLRVLRSTPATAHLPVLILTVSGNEAATSASFEAGATDYLTKPFSIPQLTPASMPVWSGRRNGAADANTRSALAIKFKYIW